MRTIFSVLAVFCLWIGTANAYVGPGAAVTMLGALVGLVGTIALALWLVFSWPLKRWLAKRRQAAESTEDSKKESLENTPEE